MGGKLEGIGLFLRRTVQVGPNLVFQQPHELAGRRVPVFPRALPERFHDIHCGSDPHIRADQDLLELLQESIVDFPACGDKPRHPGH